MNKEDYLRQLSDANFYKQIDTDPTDKVASDINKILSEMLEDDLITDKNFDFLTKSEFFEGRFYLLPKIHKKMSLGDPSAAQSVTPHVK